MKLGSFASMSKAEIKERAKNYHENATKINYFWAYKKESEEITQKEIHNFEKLVFDYFNLYYSNFKYNCFTKSRYERSMICNAIISYCVNIKKDRWKEMEHLLIQDNIFIVEYIKHVIKDRMTEYEEKLRKKSSAKKLYFYSNAIKQKLPEEFHNMMMAYSIAGNSYAKRYFKNSYI